MLTDKIAILFYINKNVKSKQQRKYNFHRMDEEET